MSIPEEKINSAKERIVEQPKARTIEIQTMFRYVNFFCFEGSNCHVTVVKQINFKDIPFFSNQYSLL